MARQGHGRRVVTGEHDTLLDAVRFRRGLLGQRKVAQQRLHDQVNALCPGLSAPPGHGRKLDLAGVTGQAFLDCLIDFNGRPAPPRSLQVRAQGRLTANDAQYWSARWKDCLPPPVDLTTRIARLEDFDGRLADPVPSQFHVTSTIACTTEHRYLTFDSRRRHIVSRESA